MNLNNNFGQHKLKSTMSIVNSSSSSQQNLRNFKHLVTICWAARPFLQPPPLAVNHLVNTSLISHNYLHWNVRHESGLVSMWLWFKRYRTLVSFILSPQGFKSIIYMAWLRLFRSHFAVYYCGPTLCCFTLPFVAEARHGCSSSTESWRSGCTRGSACRSACYSTTTSTTRSGSQRRSRSSSASSATSTGRGF